jgi:lipopolysaccharide transport system ATP-binding protein
VSSRAAVSIENVSKRYYIGASARPSHFTLRDALSQLPRRSLLKLRGQYRAEEFWALRDVSLEIGEGQVVGLIGRNGAGKSTLLKILSRIVEPTTGRVVLQGRVSSLLEVGTGFHTELTGRENIYLNGAILGMRRREIQTKFDEIVDFAEIDKFLDTPVKFYSSGMFVRLAFAVAAHLEPDVLVIDEVLSVGDQRFQKKSLAKMNSVARAGRTVIFVSHNMTALLGLCDHGVLLENGRVASVGTMEDVVAAYVQPEFEKGSGRFERADFDPANHLVGSVTLRGDSGVAKNILNYGDSLLLRIEMPSDVEGEFGIELRIKNSVLHPLAYMSSWIRNEKKFRAGDVVDVSLPSMRLAEDTYYVDVFCRIPGTKTFDIWWDAASFTITNATPGLSPISPRATDQMGAFVLDEAVFERVGSDRAEIAAVPRAAADGV